MAQKPTFVTGARAKIEVDGTTLAFATNVQYTVDITHVPVEVLGSYEVIAHEPVGYRVSGTLTVIRYTANANAQAARGAETVKGNSMFTVGSDAGAKAAFNPGNLLLSQTFDVVVSDRRDGTSNGTGNAQQTIKLRDARFERRSGGLNAKGLLEEQFSFNAILLDDDAAAVSNSGPNGAP